MNDNEKRDELRRFLNENRERIQELASQSGDGFRQLMEGVDCVRRGDDKEALICFYAAILKKCDTPRLYIEADGVLRRYGMVEEEINILKKGLGCIRENTGHAMNLSARLKKAEDALKQANNE